jgi:hypothetical protein
MTYLNFITIIVGSQCQADAINFDLLATSDLVSHLVVFISLVL